MSRERKEREKSVGVPDVRWRVRARAGVGGSFSSGQVKDFCCGLRSTDSPDMSTALARVLRQEGLGSYGAPDGGDAVFSGSGVRGEERLIEAADG